MDKTLEELYENNLTNINLLNGDIIKLIGAEKVNNKYTKIDVCFTNAKYYLSFSPKTTVRQVIDCYYNQVMIF